MTAGEEYLRSILADIAYALRKQPGISREDLAGVIERVLAAIEDLERLSV